MIIKILSDNNPNPAPSAPNLETEHGLSVYFELNNKKYLFDTGKSDIFVRNAEKLEISLNDIDYLFISHGHGDHTGGLGYFLNLNRKAKIFISKNAFKHQYYSYRHKQERFIGFNLLLDDIDLQRFFYIDSNLKILPDIFVIHRFHTNHPKPKANEYLYKSNLDNILPDDFNHELAIAAIYNNELVVFTGCAHNGLLNILDSFRYFFKDMNISTVIGGFHLLDSYKEYNFESETDLNDIARLINTNYSKTTFYTGHCTGTNCISELNKSVNNKIIPFYTGFQINL